jgi:hypothetical protein
MMNRQLSSLLLLSLLFFLPLPSLAAEPDGKVTAAQGEVTAAGKNGTIRGLAQDAPVFAGDIISTGPNSKVRIIFSDQGVIFLRPSSRFIIDAYKHSGSAAKDESKFSLVRGGFRAVTGAIGQANKDRVQINTPVATIGIRGTDHEGRFCAGDCLDLTNIGVSAPPDGLYTSTQVGQTQIGGQSFRAGEYGFTAPNRVTTRLPEAPPILVADPHLQGALSMKPGTRPAEQGEEGKKERKPEQPGEEKPRETPREKEQKPALEEQKPEQKPQAGKPGEQLGEQPGSRSAPVERPAQQEAFEIPAQPATVRSVQCN